MIRSAITVSLVPEASGGPFVFWDGLQEACRTAAQLGFHGIEIFPPAVAMLDAAAIRSSVEESGLEVAAIGTGAGWVKHQLRFTDPDAAVRARAVEFASEIVDFAAAFGAPAIIGSMQGRVEPGANREEALARLAEALEALGARAEARGVPLLYEPLNRYETNLLNRLDDAANFLRSLRSRNLRLLADLFHMNLEETSIAGSIRAAGPLIGHIHFADSNRRAVGFGHTSIPPIAAALREIRYAGYLSAEVMPLPSSRAAAEQTIAAFRQFFPIHPLSAC